MQSLKLLSISGSSDKELARSYRVKESSIRRWRSEDKEWSKAWTKVRLQLKVEQSEHESSILKDTGDSIVAQLKERGNAGNLIVSKMALEGLQKFAKKAPKILEWSEANIANNMLRKATGQENGNQVAVQINMGSLFNPTGDSSPVVEME